MKATGLLYICLLFLVINSCKMSSDKKNNDSFDDFCTIKPNNWTCKVVQNSFDSLPIPEGVEKPLAIISYAGVSSESVGSEAVYLYVYDISKKDALVKIIEESMKLAHCVPIFLGENDKYFVITSSCYVNSGFFKQEIDRVLVFKKIFTKFDENLFR